MFKYVLEMAFSLSMTAFVLGVMDFVHQIKRTESENGIE